MSLTQLIYSSLAIKGLSESELNSILETSAKNNKENQQHRREDQADSRRAAKFSALHAPDLLRQLFPVPVDSGFLGH